MIPVVQEIVDLIAAEREWFERFCRSLSDEDLARPVPGSIWAVKDFISHLATIDPPVRRWFASVIEDGWSTLGGDVPDWDVDEYNNAAVVERRDRSVETILAEAARERAELVGVLSHLTQSDIDRSVRFNSGSGRADVDLPLQRYLEGWARHDLIHTADMLRALPERRSDPLITAWLGAPEVRQRFPHLLAQ